MGQRTEKPHEPVPAVIGTYRITGVQGQGGMGVVYRAEHVATGEAVALKTLLKTDDAVLASIRREIHAFRRLRHPGIVRIVDDGVANGVPWYAMELLAGRTLRELLPRRTPPPQSGGRTRRSDVVRVESAIAPTPIRQASRVVSSVDGSDQDDAPVEDRRTNSVATPREDLLAIVARVCGALSYLHACGIVHRDLKPENILVRPDGFPVLIDLGIAGRFGGTGGREELEAVGAMMGTVAYMAPEQISGELVDARADLYALGCILYECVTGAPPFAGLVGLAALNAHLRTSPVAPSELAPDVSPEIDRLILQLVAKEPEDRLGYAHDVARILGAVLSQGGAPSSAHKRSQAYLYRPPFVGRQAALAELANAIEELSLRRRGGRVYLGGESGVGKTRLAMEAVRSATQRQVRVVLSQCASPRAAANEETADPPLHAFAPLLLAVTDECRKQGQLETEYLRCGEPARVSRTA